MLYISVILLVIAGVILLKKHLWRAYPGPFPWPLVGNIPQLMMAGGNLVRLVEKHRHKGPLLEVWLPERTLIITSPELAYQVLEEKSSNFVLRPGNMEGLKASGFYHQGIAMNNDLSNWKLSRRIFMQGLSTRFLKQLPLVIHEKWNLLHKHVLPSLLPASFEVDIFDLVRRMVTDTIGQICFGMDFGSCRGEIPEIARLLSDWIQLFSITSVQPTWVWKNPLNFHVKRLLRSNERKNVLMAELVEKWIQKAQEGHHSEEMKPFIANLCTVYLEALAEGAKMTHSQLAQTALEMMGGGTDTTVATASYCCLFLSTRPDIQDRIYREVKCGDSATMTWEQLSELKYTEQVILEVLRLRPVIPLVLRMNLQDDTIGSHTIPANTRLFIQVSSPGPFKDPSVFNPDNFDSQAPGKTYKGAVMPFGGGVRQCAGTYFATAELKLLLAHIISNYRLSPARSLDIANLKSRHGVVCGPDEPVWVTLNRRS